VAVFVNNLDDRYIDLIWKDVTTPFWNTVKILADDKVDKSKWTWVVMCCSYWDETDMYWVKKHWLEEKIILDKSWVIINTWDIELDWTYYKKARKLVIKKLTEKSKVVNSKDIIHDVWTHERCWTPIEILNMKQWFIKTIDIKDKLIENWKRIKWNPKHMQKRYLDWVENLKWDWCISRQRFFWIPIPVWYSKITWEIILPDKSQLPINPLVDSPNKLPEWHTNADIYPEQDVLDTWATSSLTPLINSKFFSDNNISNKILPMSLRPQAHDIIRTWALYTIIMSYYHTGDIPFENLMISWHVLAPKWDKISKSKDNAWTSPEELIEKYWADPIRYWACWWTFWKDIAFEEKEIEKWRKLVTKLWNAAKFAIWNLKDYDSKEILKKSDLDDIDRWIVEKSVLVWEKMKNSLESFNIWQAVSEFEKFFWNDFCDNYIEIAKWKINNSKKETNWEKTRKSSQYGLYKSLLNILKIIAPVLPHITEEIYKDFYEKTESKISIHNCDYTNLIDWETNFDFENCWVNKLFEIICLIRKHKTDNSIKYWQESNEINIYCNDNDENVLKSFINEIKAISNSKTVNFVKTEEETNKVEINL
jgi:valyl-tRNA synthetase